MKSGKYAIGTHLQIIFNDCIQEKNFPTILKDAHITPIFKKGNASVLTNYRPISVTPTFARVFEKLLLNQLVENLGKFALLNKKQFGFQSRKSSTDAVLYFIEEVIGNTEDNNDTSAVFLDLAEDFEKILEQTDNYLTENKLTLNADKTEMLFFTNHTNSAPEFSSKGEVIKPAHACRYVGVQIDSNLTFENHLNSVLSKMANAICSLYLVRKKIHLKVRIDVFKSVVLSHLSFRGVFLHTLRAKNINRINKQINWGIKVCYF